LRERRSFTHCACPPPGIGEEKSEKNLRTASEISTYTAGSVALEYGVVDLHIYKVSHSAGATIAIGVNSSAAL
jgi:hypothetical protein